MAKTSLIISSTDQLGKGLQKTVTDVNPDATNAQLVQFATKLNALTTNVYGRTDRVDKTNCDTEAGKQTPTFTLSSSTLEKKYISAGGGIGAPIVITYDGDGSISVGDFSVANPGYGVAYFGDNTYKLIGYDAGVASSFKFFASETTNYKAAAATFTITENQS